MPAEKRILSDAIVLKLTPTGERFTQVNLLTSQHGLFSLLKRNQNKANAFSIDLFDQGEAHIDNKPGENANQGFLNDFHVSKKRSGLGKNYRLLQAASWMSGLLLANPIHEETTEDLLRLAERAFDALNDGRPPQAVMLKTLYVFARDEGYPILEDWASKLSPQIASKVATLLKTPLAEIQLDEASQKSAFASLAHYVEHHTHIRLP